MTDSNAIVQWLRIFIFLVLDNVRPDPETGRWQKPGTEGRANHTGNLSLVCLRTMVLWS